MSNQRLWWTVSKWLALKRDQKGLYGLFGFFFYSCSRKGNVHLLVEQVRVFLLLFFLIFTPDLDIFFMVFIFTIHYFSLRDIVFGQLLCFSKAGRGSTDIYLLYYLYICLFVLLFFLLQKQISWIPWVSVHLKTHKTCKNHMTMVKHTVLFFFIFITAHFCCATLWRLVKAILYKENWLFKKNKNKT